MIDTFLNEYTLTPESFKGKKTVIRLVGDSVEKYKEILRPITDKMDLEIIEDWDLAVKRAVILAKESKNESNKAD